MVSDQTRLCSDTGISVFISSTVYLSLTFMLCLIFMHLLLGLKAIMHQTKYWPDYMRIDNNFVHMINNMCSES